ncbi:MAG: prolipoprotein diacylglyceryl transferase family protein [Silvibacterium sp.]
MYPRLFQFGHFAIPTYGACTAFALVAALAALLYFARRLALHANKVWNLGLIAILSTLVAARLLLVVAYFGAFRQHPFWVLGLATSRNSWINAVAILIGLAAAALYALAEGLPILRTLDCVAPSVTLALAFNRTGAFLAGLDYGLPAGHAWSVTYTSRIAALWYQTPLGIRLYPVQLYEALVSFAILIALLWWLPRRTQDGELWGAWLFLYGAAGFFLAFYRAANQTLWILPPLIAIAMVLASTGFLIHRKSSANSGGYTVGNDSPAI